MTEPIADDMRFLLGQIHADVRTLVAREKTNGQRISTLERRYWIGAGAGVVMLALASDGKIATLARAILP